MSTTSLSLLSLLIAFGDVASVAGQNQECVSTAQALDAVRSLPITPADEAALTELVVGKLNDVIKLTDTNSDCKWSVSEINDLFTLYAIDPLFANLCKCTSIEQLVAEYATDTINGLTPVELLNLASGRVELGTTLAFAIIGVPEPSNLVTLFAGAATPSADIVAATEAVEVSFEASGTRLFAGEMKNIKQYFSTMWSIGLDAVIVAYTPVAAASRRKLQTATTATISVKVTGLVPNGAASQAAAATALPDAAQASTSLGVTVTSVPVVSKRSLINKGAVPYVNAAVFALILVLVVVCCLVSKFATNKRNKVGASHVSCCTTGCCSIYALACWADASILSAILLITGSIVAFLPVDEVRKAIECIIFNIQELGTSGITEVADIANALPNNILDQVNQYIGFLPIITILPGIIAALFLFVQTLCGNKAKCQVHCVFKFNAFVIHVFCFLTLIIGVVFSAIAVAMYLPVVADQMTVLTSVCETTVPTLTRLALSLSEVPVAAVPVAQANLVTDVPAAVVTIELLCPCIYSLLDAFSVMFLPGLVLICAGIYGFFTNCGACVSSCCPGSAKVSPGSSTA